VERDGVVEMLWKCGIFRESLNLRDGTTRGVAENLLGDWLWQNASKEYDITSRSTIVSWLEANVFRAWQK
jgi:hypothetical protein